MRKLIYILLYCLTVVSLPSQKEYFNWYFGWKVGFTFNTTDSIPLKLSDSKMGSHGGTASISDSKGNLLFYTNGENVWNRKHEIMPNGSGLHGDLATNQSSLIVPKPGESSKYYLFTADNVTYNKESKGYNYSLLDMSLDSGFGDVVPGEKNKRLLDSSTGQSAATRQYDGKNYWVVTHEKHNNCFFVYSVTEMGVRLSHIDTIGSNYNFSDGRSGTGSPIKFSISGKKMLAGIYHGVIDIFDFDNRTGRISNPLTLESEVFKTVHGIEFSPNEMLIYWSIVSTGSTGYDESCIYQMSLNGLTKDSILKSIVRLAIKNWRYAEFGQLQIGPDYKIYSANGFRDSVGVINNPDIPGIECGYVENAINVHYGPDSSLAFNNTVRYGLPNIIASDLRELIILKSDTVCSGETLILHSRVFSPKTVDSFSWTGPVNFISSDSMPILSNATTDMTGWYKLQVQTNGKTITDSVYILILPKPDVEITTNGKSGFCKGDSLEIEAAPDIAGDYTYLWSTGDTTGKIIVKKAGEYSVVLSNTYGCSDTANITIDEYPIPNANIEFNGTPEFCEGDSLMLTAKPDSVNYTYKWQDGSIANKLIVKKAGYYYVWVTNENGCTDSTGVWIDTKPVPIASIEIIGKPNLCKGDTAILRAKPDSDSYTYRWQDGSTSDTFQANEAGYYYVWVTNESGCSDSAGVLLESSPEHVAEILISGIPEICEGDSITLTAKPDTGNYSYEWQDGSTAGTYTAKSAGFYYVIVTNEFNCSDSASVRITYLPKPEAEIEITGSTKICKGDSVLLTANPIGGNYTYQWQDGSQLNTISAKEQGYYYVWVTNENGCKDSAGILIETMPGPDAGIMASGKTEICDGDSVLLNAIPDGDYTYKWNDGSTENSLIANKPGNYTVMVTDENGCSDSSEITITKAHLIQFSIDTTTALVGTGNVNIIVRAKTQINNQFMPSDIQIVIYFDATAFVPEGQSFITQNYIGTDGFRYLTLERNGFIFSNDNEILFTISGKTYIGHNSKNQIFIGEIIIDSLNICIDTMPGLLINTGICQIDLLRIKQFIPVQLNINPNPANSEIEVEIKGDTDGLYKLELFNMHGLNVYKNTWFHKKGMIDNFKLSILDLPNGVYQTLLVTNSEIISEHLIIVK
jgi:hypothetical protein